MAAVYIMVYDVQIAGIFESLTFAR